MAKRLKPHSSNLITEWYTGEEKNRLFCNAVSQTLHRLCIHEKRPWMAWDICQRVPIRSKGACLVMALTSCRYSEIDWVDYEDMFNGTSFLIFQPKQEKFRHHPALLYGVGAGASDWDDTTPICVVSYDQTRGDIQRALPDEIRSLSHNWNDSTHIFRHLNATWMYKQGMDLVQISSYLDHKSTEATESYIHEDLAEVLQ